MYTVAPYQGFESLHTPPEHLPCADDDPGQLMQRLLRLAGRLSPRQLATAKRGPKPTTPKGHVADSIAKSHVATDRVLKAAGKRR